MFTGIVEAQGKVTRVTSQGNNVEFLIEAPFLSELKVDQSISHNGVCLTVTRVNKRDFAVTAIKETLDRSNLADLQKGSVVNLERCLKLDSRLDGHIVQGHIDATGTCIKIKSQDGSWIFTFEYAKKYQNLVIPKGSICVNGVSLTVIKPKKTRFSVAIIPFTFSETNFCKLKKGDSVNLEFDILGKYISRHLKLNS